MGEYGLFVTVQFGLENETITVNAGEHGTIEHKNKVDDSQDYKYGDTAVVTVTPNEGFMIETITVDGKLSKYLKIRKVDILLNNQLRRILISQLPSQMFIQYLSLLILLSMRLKMLKISRLSLQEMSLSV